jgi:tellurite resistance protein TehA-like permease
VVLSRWIMLAAIGLGVVSVQLPPARFTPDDWIVMGALAISAVTASSLLRAEPAARRATLGPTLLAGGAAACWAIASAAVAALVVLQVGHLRRDRSARRYQARWWAAVFPLGIYGVSTHQLAVVGRWGHLEPVARSAAWVAAAAWTIVAAAALAARTHALDRATSQDIRFDS